MSDKKPQSLKLSASDKIDTPLYKKKTYDFTDYAYREAVNRLKFLLTEAYEPTKFATSVYYRGVDDTKSETSDNQSGIERPSITEVSKYFNPGAVSRYNAGASSGRRYSFLTKDPPGGSILKPAVSTASLQPPPSVCSVSQNFEVAQPPPELLGFIEKQENYIEQLERESQYCREELSTLLKKVKDVVSENEALTDRARSKVLYQVDSSESEDLDLDRLREKAKLSGPNIVFESRISELEAQLAQSQIDLKKLFTENEENKRKLTQGASDVSCSDVYRKQVENLQRDKQNLEENVRKLQLTIDQLKDSEATNYSKSQRSRDMIEHVAFERNQAEIEIRRLKDELERQHERVREVQHEMAKRLTEERSNAERRYTFQVDQLGGDLSNQWEQATKLQLEVERMKRIESDYKRELSQKNSQMDELKLELKNKTAIFMSDLNQASAEKQSLEQEITSLRLQLERAERQSKVEMSRLNAEITSLRQRLDRADADLLHSKRENLKLADEVASLEKELTLGALNKETRPSKELAKIISDMEAKHTSTVSELEGMVQDQKQLMEKLTAECKSLTHKLEDTTLKHKNEKKELRQTNNELMDRLKQVWLNYKEISPAFQTRKCSTEQLESDSNISSTSNNDSKALKPRHDPAAVPLSMCPLDQYNRRIVASSRDLPHSHRQAGPLDPDRSHLISSTPVEGNSHTASFHEPVPPMTTMSPKATSTPTKSEVIHDCRDNRYPMKTLCQNYKERSRSLDILTLSDHPGPVITQSLNQTAPAAVVDYLASPLLEATERLDNRSDNNSNHMSNQFIQIPSMSPNAMPRWNNINHPRPINISQPVRCTMKMSDMTLPNTIPHSNTIRASTRDMQTSSTHRSHTISKATVSNSTRIISNHMMHSSTPLSKYMMNQTIPPQSQSPEHSNQHSTYQPTNQCHWNKQKAIEMWGTHATEDPREPPILNPEEHQTDLSSHSINSQQAAPLNRNYCRNSLPRQLPQSCDFQSIDSYPSLSISSPSLFDTSPESSLTPSPSTTVLNNYSAASPNPP
ncbi:uncharacterized protein LOC129769456 isoform X3 [Toxorhynchites rutilus septentrionalis]|uniref:uncharacterized protein LOC129769456 isoform X3 n=1 Tax=Toxorhynchites rutilus septentrionalis TaxID=329112 RepID=UPI00247A8A19|nr:uncharacterized protein LOC129769456 isoform X3 [Toxorhynchites rutilus septentrionalis]